MVVIATPDAEIAKRLGELIEGQKTYLLGPSDRLAVNAGTEEEEARRFRHAVHSAQPDVMVLDVRVGKQVFKALDHVRRLLEVDSAPAMILLLPFSSRTVRSAAAALGCYDVILIDRRRAYEQKVANAVVDALAARASGALPKRRVSESVH